MRTKLEFECNLVSIISRNNNEWSSSTALAFFLDGTRAEDGRDNDFFVMLNGHRKKKCSFKVPSLDNDKTWRRIIDTATPSPEDILAESDGELIAEGRLLDIAPMGAVVLISSESSQ